MAEDCVSRNYYYHNKSSFRDLPACCMVIIRIYVYVLFDKEKRLMVFIVVCDIFSDDNECFCFF